ncbi:DNA recombination protein RmuC, partial [Francisella tularensis subsp. holarctica]|uniref:DNA recombination protein RmuC n=1 Tax=Francisella tularensis TaxID=263 RepID=UPI002381BC94
NDYMADAEDHKHSHLKAHINSIREHIKVLANKNYENLKGINSLYFIFMFIPIEWALLLALSNDASLYDEAFKQKIILVSPT